MVRRGFLVPGPRLGAPEGVLPKSLFPDSLHPLKPGYVLWKDAVLPYFKKAVGK